LKDKPNLFNQKIPVTVTGQLGIKLAVKKKDPEESDPLVRARALQNQLRKEAKS
jgi:hypothetical protein